jgi:hypothetical protein
MPLPVVRSRARDCNAPISQVQFSNLGLVFLYVTHFQAPPPLLKKYYLLIWIQKTVKDRLIASETRYPNVIWLDVIIPILKE